MPVGPVSGWTQADLPRRVAALLALPLAAVMGALAVQDRATGLLQLLWLLVGPGTFSSLARVLRPEPLHPERTPRHLLAAAATALASPVVVELSFGPQGYGASAMLVMGSAAFVLGLTTLLWGLVAVTVRWFTIPPVTTRSAAPAPATAS